jgi:hypothetical protein
MGLNCARFVIPDGCRTVLTMPIAVEVPFLAHDGAGFVIMDKCGTVLTMQLAFEEPFLGPDGVGFVVHKDLGFHNSSYEFIVSSIRNSLKENPVISSIIKSRSEINN